MNFCNSNYKLPGEILEMPEMLRVRQRFDGGGIGDIPRRIRQECEKLPPCDLAGKRVAVTAGSRGIANIVAVTKTVVGFLLEKGACPFIVPAMGSHGGGTAEGQTAVLAHYGITPQSMGVPIVSSMQTRKIGQTPSGVDIYCDVAALEADHIVVVNRVKAHSDFKADYESGLCKMMMVGLGKHEGATTVHRAGSLNFGRLLPEAAQVFIGTGKILFGLALVENAHEETQQIEVLPADGIVSREKELLALAKKIQGRLYLDEIDVLIVDEMGKNISGAGMDPNVTGRSGTGDPAFTAIAPKIRQIVVLGLTACSEGNAVGMGMADIISIDLARQIDLGPTYTNVLTAGVPLAGKLPLVANSETDTLFFALMALGKRALSELKIVHIKNTLELETLEVSVNYEEEIRRKKNLFDAAYEKTRLAFDPRGRLRRI